MVRDHCPVRSTCMHARQNYRSGFISYASPWTRTRRRRKRLAQPTEITRPPCLHAIDKSIHLEVHNSNIRFQQNYCSLLVVVNVERIQIDSYVMANMVDIGQAFTIQRQIEMKKLPSHSSN